jgi:hypothetical protein
MAMKNTRGNCSGRWKHGNTKHKETTAVKGGKMAIKTQVQLQ